jgi:mono/diheme cytochrome c family protein
MRSPLTTLLTLLLAVPALAQTPQIERGKYLVTIGICEGCHSPRDAQGHPVKSMRLAGGRRSGGLMTPNLTPDIETGLGKWSEAQIVEALRNGVRPDGSRIRPPMAIFWYRHFSDADARAIAAYLKSVPPIANKVERTPVTTPAPVYDRVETVPEPADNAARGKYLAQTVSHCMQCHTPREGQFPDLARVGAGGNTYSPPQGGEVVSPNLTPGNTDGVAKWTDAQLKHAITHGVRPDGGQMVNVMDFELYEQMKPEDLDLLVGYIRSLKPVETPQARERAPRPAR